MKTTYRFPISASFLIMLLVLARTGFPAEGAAGLRQKGIEALKESQSNPAAIVTAARNFAKAAAQFESEGKTDLAVEMNSYLYWCKKKMSYADIEAFLKDEELSVSGHLTAVEKKAPAASEAEQYLARADAFAKSRPTEFLLIAIRYFEVADRFVGSPISLDAQRKSLEYQQKAIKALPEILKKQVNGTLVSQTFNPIGRWSRGDDLFITLHEDKTLSTLQRGSTVRGTWSLNENLFVLHFDNEWGQSTCRIKDPDCFIERESNFYRRIKHFATSPATGKQIDLLAKIRPQTDAVSGRWGFSGNVLVTENDRSARLEIPFTVPLEYDFKIVFMRSEGNDAVGQIVHRSGNEFSWMMDGRKGKMSGFEYIGKVPFDRNVTAFNGTLIKNGVWHTSVIRMRKNSTTALFDDREIAQVTEPDDSLSINSDWKLRDPKHLGILHHDNKVIFRSIELIPFVETVNSKDSKSSRSANVEVVFETGWEVFVNGNPAISIETRRGETPCKINLPLGWNDIALARDGFTDIHCKVEVVDGGIKASNGTIVEKVEPNAQSNPGNRTLKIPPLLKAECTGTFQAFDSQMKLVNKIRLFEDGSFQQDQEKIIPEHRWSVAKDGRYLILRWLRGEDVYERVGNLLRCTNDSQRTYLKRE